MLTSISLQRGESWDSFLYITDRLQFAQLELGAVAATGNQEHIIMQYGVFRSAKSVQASSSTCVHFIRCITWSDNNNTKTKEACAEMTTLHERIKVRTDNYHAHLKRWFFFFFQVLCRILCRPNLDFPTGNSGRFHPRKASCDRTESRPTTA